MNTRYSIFAQININDGGVLIYKSPTSSVVEP